MTSKDEVKTLIEAAVNAAVEASMRGIDEKLQAAVNLGATIGAAAGAEVGAKAAVRAVERERKGMRKRDYDWKYHNTKLLLRNYRRLNEYYRNAVFDTGSAEEADADFEDVMRSMGPPGGRGNIRGEHSAQLHHHENYYDPCEQNARLLPNHV